jgi:hypothetical protein
MKRTARTMLTLAVACLALRAFAQDADVDPKHVKLFIGVLLSLIALVRHLRIPFPRWTEVVPPYAIGSTAMSWRVQRLAAF